MTIRTISGETIDNPTMWQLGMSIGTHALDILLRKVVGEPQIIVHRLTYDPAATSLTAALEETVYANPLLLKPFKRVDTIIRSSRYHIVPPGVATNSDAVNAIINNINDPARRITPVTDNIDSHNSVILCADKALVGFLSRTYPESVIKPHISVITRYLTAKSRLGNTGKLYVNLRDKSIDIIAFGEPGLTAAATYACENDNDAAYYILAAAKYSGFDTSSDEMLLCGDPERRSRLIPMLRKFVNYVMPDVFPASLIAGCHQALKAPVELIVQRD